MENWIPIPEWMEQYLQSDEDGILRYYIPQRHLTTEEDRSLRGIQYWWVPDYDCITGIYFGTIIRIFINGDQDERTIYRYPGGIRILNRR